VAGLDFSIIFECCCDKLVDSNDNIDSDDEEAIETGEAAGDVIDRVTAPLHRHFYLKLSVASLNTDCHLTPLSQDD